MDLSGVVSALLNQYATVLAGHRRRMTGNPDGLRASARSYRTIADQEARTSISLIRQRRGLADHWQGIAYQAYGGAAGRVIATLDTAEARLRRHAAALDRAADALQAAAGNADAVISDFRSAAQALTSQARAVAPAQAQLVINAARQLGDQAVDAMRALERQLGAVLAQVAAELGAPVPATAGQTVAASFNGQDTALAVTRALAGDASPEQLRQAMAEVGAVTERLRTGAPPSEADRAYLSAFYRQLGDKVFDLPGYIGASEHRWNTSLFGLFGQTAPGFSAAEQQGMMRTLGNGILTLSQDPATLPASVRDLVHQPAATHTNVGMDSFGFTHERQVPPGREPITGVVGETTWTNNLSVPRYAQFEALAQMTGTADRNLAGGTDFSAALSRRVGEIADVTQRLNPATPLPTNDPRYWVSTDTAVLYDERRVDATMTSMLDVSTRDHAANASIAGDGATLRNLTGFAWADDGRAAGRVVDWIGPGTADPAGHDLARGAYVNLTQSITDPSALAQVTANLRENPQFANALAQATAPNLDLYGQPLDGLDTDPGAGRLGSTDARHMLMLAQTTQDGRNEISAGADLYKEYLLSQANAGAIPMEQAGRYAGNVDGLTNAAAANAIWYANVTDAEQATKVAQEAYTRQLAIANAVKDVVGFGAGQIPVAGSFAGFATGQMGNLLTSAMQPPNQIHPQSLPTDVFRHPQFTGNGAVYTAAGDLAAYELRHGGTAPQVQVGSVQGAAAEEAVRWARSDPGRAEYLTAYQTAAHYVYLENLATGNRESIQYDVQGRRP